LKLRATSEISPSDINKYKKNEITESSENENDEKGLIKRKINLPSFNAYRHMKSKQSRLSLSAISDL